MLDRYVEGSSNRMSPEAPVPIVLIEEESHRLGGAANVAYNLHNLGAETYLLGCLGTDDYGKILQKLIDESGIHSLILEDHHTTCVKTRVISKSQHLLRIDREKHYTISDKMINHCTNYLLSLKPEIIVISDYAKGMITKSLMNQIAEVCPKSKILIDPKGNDWKKYGRSYLIKPNLSEFLTVSQFDVFEHANDQQLQDFRSSLQTENLLVTLSDKGMVLINRSGVTKYNINKAEVYDVTGAGDTALAVISLGLYHNWAIDKAIKTANIASRYVVTKPKTHVLTINELETECSTYKD